jgi:hypothetical protein
MNKLTIRREILRKEAIAIVNKYAGTKKGQKVPTKKELNNAALEYYTGIVNKSSQ